MVPHPPGVQHTRLPPAAQQHGTVWMVAGMAVRWLAPLQGQAKAPDGGSRHGTDGESTPCLHQHRDPRETAALHWQQAGQGMQRLPRQPASPKLPMGCKQKPHTMVLQSSN